MRSRMYEDGTLHGLNRRSSPVSVLELLWLLDPVVELETGEANEERVEAIGCANDCRGGEKCTEAALPRFT